MGSLEDLLTKVYGAIRDHTADDQDQFLKIGERLARLEENKKQSEEGRERTRDRFAEGDEQLQSLDRTSEDHGRRIALLEESRRDAKGKAWEIVKLLLSSMLGAGLSMFVWWMTH